MRTLAAERPPAAAPARQPGPYAGLRLADDAALEAQAEHAAARVLSPHARAGGPPPLSRAATDGPAGTPAPASVHRTLADPGEPLPQPLRRRLEPRFGHDFGRVRVHRDAAAARSAHEVQAAAYSVGQHLVFGHGRYAPEQPGGRALLAHELAHVVQHGAAPPVRLHRRGFFEQLAGLFAGDDYDEATLTAYLEQLRRTQRIEDFTDSDNKARAVVAAWQQGDSPYVLTQDLKALLILEMLSGFTGDDDERAILQVLERSYNFELAHIFGAGGVSAALLHGALQGQEQTCLDDFLARRFAGGAAALAAGRVEPVGDAVPFGDPLPTRCAPATDMPPGLGVDWSLPCVLGILCSRDADVVQALRGFAVQSVGSIEVDYWQYDGAGWSIAEVRRQAGAANSESTPPEIHLLRRRNCETVVQTVVHEVRHQQQAPGSRLERETDAYRYAEEWTVARGLPGRAALRAPGPDGRPAVDDDAVRAYVQQRYPGTASEEETIVGHREGDGHTEVAPAEGAHFFRPPQRGDSHWGETRFIAPQPIAASAWACPGAPAAAP